MRFKVGQSVVCIVDHWTFKQKWFFGMFTRPKDSFYGPKKNEVVTVSGDAANGYIFIEEYPGPCKDVHGKPAFNENCFEPLISDEELLKELQTITELV